MNLFARMEIRRGDFELDVELRAAEGETVALVGPNGSGKSTFVAALAGLIGIDRGEVRLGGELLERSPGGVRVPSRKRNVGVVFQERRLFPSMNARENVAFGLRSRGVGAKEARRRADDWLDRFGLAPCGDRRVDELSGGEAQRVALARALIVEPTLLLLDEPLSALDVELRGAARRLVSRALREFSGVRIVITHDPLEAFALADRVVILEEGRVTQEGTPSEVARRPVSSFAASLAGVNLFKGTIRVDGDRRFVDVGETSLRIGCADFSPGESVVAVVKPQAVVIALDVPRSSLRNHFTGRIESIESHGGTATVRIGPHPALTAEVTMTAVEELGLREGKEVWASVKAIEIEVYPA